MLLVPERRLSMNHTPTPPTTSDDFDTEPTELDILLAILQVAPPTDEDA